MERVEVERLCTEANVGKAGRLVLILRCQELTDEEIRQQLGLKSIITVRTRAARAWRRILLHERKTTPPAAPTLPEVDEERDYFGDFDEARALSSCFAGRHHNPRPPFYGLVLEYKGVLYADAQPVHGRAVGFDDFLAVVKERVADEVATLESWRERVGPWSLHPDFVARRG